MRRRARQSSHRPARRWRYRGTPARSSSWLRTLAYGRVSGVRKLREAIVDYVRRARGVNATVQQVFIVSGTQQALDLTARMLLDPGDRVVVENPCYQAARQVFQDTAPRWSRSTSMRTG